nr:unnamed protein product [Callosobruchus chinensis]
MLHHIHRAICVINIMGNSGSHLTNNVSLKEEQWANSFQKSQPLPPKFSQLSQQHRVLPEQGFPPKLKPTDNGEILQSGGTIFGKKKNLCTNQHHMGCSTDSTKMLVKKCSINR